MRAVPEQILPFIPFGRRFSVLGTDGMGRSDTREALRRYFEVDAGHIVVSTLSALFNDGRISADVVEDAIRRYDIDTEAPNPFII
jgi:pyruvate dehydrogenase E1 component